MIVRYIGGPKDGETFPFDESQPLKPVYHVPDYAPGETGPGGVPATRRIGTYRRDPQGAHLYYWDGWMPADA